MTSKAQIKHNVNLVGHRISFFLLFLTNARVNCHIYSLRLKPQLFGYHMLYLKPLQCILRSVWVLRTQTLVQIDFKKLQNSRIQEIFYKNTEDSSRRSPSPLTCTRPPPPKKNTWPMTTPPILIKLLTQCKSNRITNGAVSLRSPKGASLVADSKWLKVYQHCHQGFLSIAVISKK